MYLMNNTIVILANSVKNRAHCVAGKCIRTRQWIRPVGDANGCALSESLS
ncbi:MAG: dual OB domain-containing protein [Psychrobacter celer]